MLTRSERREFDERGVVFLRGAVRPEIAETLRDRIYAFLAERGVSVDVTVNASVPAPVAKAFAFEGVWGERVIGAIDDVLGAGRCYPPKHAGQILSLNAPSSDTIWSLPRKSWHLDYQAPAALDSLPGVQVFLCIDRVEPRAGATLAAAGVHRLIDSLRRRHQASWPGRSSEVRKSLQREVPWIAALTSERAGEDRIARFMAQVTEFDGASLQVVELAGEPGDVIVMHPWLLHAGSPNCGTRPRLVLTERIRAK